VWTQIGQVLSMFVLATDRSLQSDAGVVLSFAIYPKWDSSVSGFSSNPCELIVE
jgi:hypothetical protein